MKNKLKPHCNVKVLMLSILAGGTSWVVCRTMYLAWHDVLPVPLLMGMLFALLAAVVSCVVLAGSLITGSFDKDSVLYDGPARAAAYLVAGVISVGLLAMGLEYLYELEPPDKVVKPSSYVLAVDESGSMAQNDDRGIRYEAIRDIMAEEAPTFPFMVYTFSDDTRIVRDMAPGTDGMDIPIRSDGGTAIYGTLSRILEDYKDGVWDGGSAPKVILLSDGYATDLNGFLWFRGNALNGILAEFRNSGITISTVGLGAMVDTGTMTKIAETTGGVYVHVGNAQDLVQGLKQAATSHTERNLLSIRCMRHLNHLYGGLRIAFLTILGAVLGSLMMLAYVEDGSIPMIIFSSICAAAAGSILLELGLGIGMPQEPLWLALWILFAATVGYVYPKLAAGHGGVVRANDSYMHDR